MGDDPTDPFTRRRVPFCAASPIEYSYWFPPGGGMVPTMSVATSTTSVAAPAASVAVPATSVVVPTTAMAPPTSTPTTVGPGHTPMAPAAMEDVIKLMQQQLVLQQQQMSQMVSVLNGISARLPPSISAPNIPGWPPSGIAAPAATFTNPPPGFGTTTIVAPSIPTAIPTPLPAAGSLPSPAVSTTPPPAHLPTASAALPLGTVAGIFPLHAASGTGPSPPPAVAGPSGSSAPHLTRAFGSPQPTPSRQGTPSRSQGRGRSVGLTRDIRDRRSRTPSTEAEDDDDGYAVNRERRETACKSIPLKSFSLSNKDQEFPIWIEQFEDAVNRGHNPHSLRRHHNYCLQWLPGSLETDAYAIWKECQHARTNWLELKKELEDKFEDPAVRKEWRSNPKALMWDEYGETLQSFLAKVKRKVNTYDSDIATTDEARAANYNTRFVNGMPEDYINHLNLNMPTKKQKVEKALEICVRFQAFKKSKNQGKAEVGASVAFQDPTMPSRVTKTEMDIIRLGNRLKAVEGDRSNSKPPQDPEQARTYMAGRSPGRPFRSNWQGGRQHTSRSNDRQARFEARKRGGFMRRNPNRSHDRREGNPRTPPHNQPNQQTEREEGLALMSEPESDGEGLDDTVADFMRMEQMDQAERLEYFGALRDQAKAGN